MIPNQAGINLENKQESQKHKGEQFHETIQAAHEPARSEKEREG